MKSPEEVKRELYEKWMRRANEDLAVAEQLLSDGVPYFGSMGFHAQQATEKFLKAYLVWRQVEFRKLTTSINFYSLSLCGNNPFPHPCKEFSF